MMLFVIEQLVDPEQPCLGWRPSMEPGGEPRAFLRKADARDRLRVCEQRGEHTGVTYRLAEYWRKEAAS